MPLAFIGLNRTSYACQENGYAHQVTSRSRHAMLMLGVTRSFMQCSLGVVASPSCVDGPIILSRIGSDEIVQYGIPFHYIPTAFTHLQECKCTSVECTRVHKYSAQVECTLHSAHAHSIVHMQRVSRV